MKRFFAIVLCAVLSIMPFAAYAEGGRSVELSHECALFDMGVTHAAAIQPGGEGYAWGYNCDGPIGNGVLTGSCPTPFNWGSGAAQVSVNAKTTLFIDNNSVLWIMGETWWGIGGDPTMPENYVAVSPVQVATNVRMASMGSNHVVFVKNDDTLWVYGENAHGQLGDNTVNANYTPRQMLTGVSYAAAGDCLTAAVKTDGTLWVWGYNDMGQVGNNSTSDRKTPVQVLTNVYTVSAMGNHVMAIKNDNTLWAWGDNTYGQLGKGNTTVQRTPVQVMTGAAQVSAGFDHTGVIKTDGTLWFCGRNYMGPFGNGSSSGYSAANPNWVQTAGSYLAVKCGDRITGVVTADGRLLVAGDNTYGQLGLGFTANPAGGRFFDSFTANGLVIFGASAANGDIDGSGEVEITDALTALRAALGLVDVTPSILAAGDVDGDGEMTISDALMILRFALGLITAF